MKTTDSVKDKFIKWLAEESGEPEHLIMLMQSVYVNPESMFKFYSHSLAEARREEQKEMAKRYEYQMTFLQKQNELLLEQLRLKHLSEPITFNVSDLLTGDNPERKA